MKKIFVSICVLLVCLLAFGCEAQADPIPTTETIHEAQADPIPTTETIHEAQADPIPTTETIHLTKDNFYDYFYLEDVTRNFQSDVSEVLGYKYESGSAECIITISKKKPCVISDVVVTVEISSLDYYWDKMTRETTIGLSVDGDTTKAVLFEFEDVLQGLIEKPSFLVLLKDVSGTVEITK